MVGSIRAPCILVHTPPASEGCSNASARAARCSAHAVEASGLGALDLVASPDPATTNQIGGLRGRLARRNQPQDVPASGSLGITARAIGCVTRIYKPLRLQCNCSSSDTRRSYEMCYNINDNWYSPMTGTPKVAGAT